MASNATVGILRVLLTANTAEFDTAMKRVSSAAATMSKDFGAMGRQATQLGASLTRTLTVPLLGIGVGAAKLAMDFESSFAGVRKTVKATEPEFAAMAQAFRDLSKEIPVNVNELTRLGEAAGALGIPKEEVVDFARVMALLGVTTNLTSDAAAEGIAKIQNIFGAAGKDTERFASTLVALGNDGASTEDQILSMATRIAGAGNAIGLTQGQVLAFASALSSVGLEAEAGGSAISRVFIDIASAVSEGGDAVSGFAETAGMSVDQFSQKFKTDAAGAINDFIIGLGKVKESGGDLIGTLEELGFTEIRVRDTLLRLAGAGDEVTKALNTQGLEWEKNTALMAEARERFKTTEAALGTLWNQIKDVGITLGNALLPTINLTIQAFGQLIPVIDVLARGFNAMPTAIQAVVVGLGLVAAAAGPLIFIFGQLLIAMSAITGAFTAKGLATKALIPLLTTLGNTVPVLTARLWLMNAGVAGLSLAFGGLAIAAASAFAVFKAGEQVWLLLSERAERAAGATTEQARRYAMMEQASKIAGRAVNTYAEAVEIVTQHTRASVDAMERGVVVYEQAAGPSEKLAASTTKLGEAHAGMSAQLAKTKEKVAALSAEQRRAIVDGDALGLSAKEITAALNKQWPALDITEEAVKLYTDSLKGTSKAAKAATQDLEELKEALNKLSGRALIDDARKLEVQLKAIGGASGIMLDQLADMSEGFKKAATAARSIGDLALAKHFDDLAAATNPLNETLKRAGVSLGEVSGAMIDTVQPARDADAMITEFLSTVTGADGVVTKFAGSSLPELVRQLELLGSIDPGFEMEQTIFTPIIPGSVIDTTGVKTGGQFGAAMMKGLKGSFIDLGPTILGALQGGGSVLQSVGSLFGQGLGTSLVEGFGKNIVGALGKTLGGAFNAIIPGLGAMLGPLIGKIGEFFQGLFGVSAEVKKARAELDKFQDSLAETATKEQKAEAGGRKWALTLIQARDAIVKLGGDAKYAETLVARLLNTDNPDDMRRAMEELNGVFEELEEHTAEAGDIFDDIMAAAEEAGGAIPESMQPAIDQLIALGLLTDEQAEKLRALGEGGAVNVEKMEEAMGVLQGRIESLGPAFQQAKLDKTAKQYVNAIDTLIKGGADVGGVLFDAREELSALATESLRTGRTLPANLKPWIEELHRAGLLVDENGDKLEDLSGIRYGEAIKTEAEIAAEGWQKILDRIDKLIEKLTGPLDRAIDGVADREIEVKVGVVYDDPGFTPRNPEDENRTPGGEEGFATGTKGRTGSWFSQFGSAFPTTLHGTEAVITPAQAVPFALDALESLFKTPAASEMSSVETTNTHTNNEQIVILAPVIKEADMDDEALIDKWFSQLGPGVAINRGNSRVALKKVLA